MELGQYSPRSGRSVDMAKSSNGTRTVQFLSRVNANWSLVNVTLESGSRPEQVWTRPNPE